MKKILFSIILLLTGSQATQVNPMICGPVMDSMKKDGPNVLASVDRVKATYEKEKEKYQYTNDNAKVRAAYDTFCQSKFMTYGTRTIRKLNRNFGWGCGNASVSKATQDAVNKSYKTLNIDTENQLPIYDLTHATVPGMVKAGSNMYINEELLNSPAYDLYPGIKLFSIHHEVSHVKYNDFATDISLSILFYASWVKMFPKLLQKKNSIKINHLITSVIGMGALWLLFLKGVSHYEERRADLSAAHALQCGACVADQGLTRNSLGNGYLNKEELEHIKVKQYEAGKKCDYHRASVLEYDKEKFSADRID
jgi:hypothetical protein